MPVLIWPLFGGSLHLSVESSRWLSVGGNTAGYNHRTDLEHHDFKNWKWNNGDIDPGRDLGGVVLSAGVDPAAIWRFYVNDQRMRAEFGPRTVSECVPRRRSRFGRS
jgi:hypothetical protein